MDMRCNRDTGESNRITAIADREAMGKHKNTDRIGWKKKGTY